MGNVSCQSCPSGQISSNNANACTACGAGTRANPAINATQCVGCQPGSFSLGSSTQCIVCQPGNFTSSTSLACQRCPLGSYSGLGSVNCSNCTPGFSDEDSNPSTTCTACPPGRYTYTFGAFGACPFCAVGTTDADSTPNTACTPCNPGYISPPNFVGPCTPCPAGTSNINGVPASGCSPCPVGSHVPQGSSGSCALYTCANGTTDFDSNSSTPCIPCPSGSYTNSSSTGACPVCPPGFADIDVSPATPCSRCTSGTYSPGNTTLCRDCAAGTVDSDNDPSSECVACNTPFQYQPELGATACRVVTECFVPLSFQIAAPTATSDRICKNTTLCNPRSETLAREPTYTSDRVCVSSLGSYVIATFEVGVPRAQYELVEDIVPQTVINGSLLNQLRATSPFGLYTNVLLINVQSPEFLSLIDNPPASYSFVIAAVSLPGFTGSFSERPQYDFVTFLATALNVSAVSLIGSNTTSGGASLQVFFRIQVLANMSDAVSARLTARLSSGFLNDLRSATSLSAISSVAVTLRPYIVEHIDCVYCDLMNVPAFLYRPFQCIDSLIGNCGNCSACPFGTYVDTPCTGEMDTVCLPVPNFTRSLPMTISASQGVLPTSDTLLPALGTSWRSFSTAGRAPNTNVAVTVSVPNSISALASTTISPLTAMTITATLLDTVVYFDAPRLRAVFQVRDSKNNVLTAPCTVVVTVVSTAVSATCNPNSNGICIANLDVTSLFQANTLRNVSVSYAFQPIQNGQQGLTTFSQQVTLWGNFRNPVFNDTLQAVLPTMNFYPNDVVSIPVYGHAVKPIGSFTVTVAITSGTAAIQSLDISDPNLYSSSTAVTGSLASISAAPGSGMSSIATQSRMPNGVQQDQLLFTARIRVSVAGTIQVSFDCKDFALADRNIAIRINGAIASLNAPIPILLTSRYPQIGQISVVNNNNLAIFASPSQGELVNTRVLNSVPQSFPLAIYAITGQAVGGASNLVSASCTSASSSVVKVASDCSSISFDGTENAGAASTTITATSGGLQVSFSLRVYFPQRPLTVVAENTNLLAIQGAFNPRNCQQRYMQTRVQATTTFSAGVSLSFFSDVTGLMSSLLTSSNTNVVSVNSTTSLAIGLAEGTATVGYGTLGFVIVQVFNRVGMVSGIDLWQLASLSATANSNATAIVATGVSAPATLRQEDVTTALAFGVWVFDPLLLTIYRMDLSLADGVSLTSNSSAASIVGASAQARDTGVAAITAVWNSGCPASIAYSAMTNVVVQLPAATSATATLSASKITFVGNAAATAGIPTSATIQTITLVYPLYNRNALSDSRVSFDYSQANSLFTVSGTPGNYVLNPNGLSRTGTGNLIIRFSHESVIATVPITVVAAQNVSASAAPFPSGSSSGYTLRAIGGSGKFEQASLSASLFLTDATFLSVTSLPQTTYADVTSGGAITSLSSNVVTVLSRSTPATASLRVAFATFSTVVSISILTASPVTVTSINSVSILGSSTSTSPPTLNGVNGNTFQLLFGAVFSDGFSLPPATLFASNTLQYSSVFSFSTTDTSYISVNAISGVVTLLANAPGTVSVTVTSGTFSSTIQMFCNLVGGANEIDLGASTGAPVPSVAVNTNFSFVVSISSTGMAGYSFTISFDPTKVAFFSATQSSAMTAAEFSFTATPGSGSVNFGGVSTRGINGQIQVATLNFRAIGVGTSLFSASMDNIYALGIPPVLVTLNVQSVAGQVPFTVRSFRRSIEERDVSEERDVTEDIFAAAPFAFPELPSASTVLSRRDSSCSAYPLGDTTEDCFFNIADVLQTTLYVSYAANNFNGDLSADVLALNRSKSRMDAMNLDFGPEINGKDSYLMGQIFFGSLRFVSLPTVIPVSANNSQCTLQILVDVQQSSSKAEYATDPAASSTTFVYFMLSPRSGGAVQTEFTQELTSSSWNTTLISSVPTGAFTSGLLLASYLGGTTYRIASPTSISMSNLGLTVLLVTKNPSASPGTNNNYLFTKPGTLYGRSEFSVTNPSFGTTAVDSSDAFESIQTFSNTYDTATCIRVRSPTNLASVSVSPTSISVSWSGPAEQPYVIVAYRLYYRRVAGQANAQPNTLALESWSLANSVLVPITGSPNIGSSSTITGLQPFIVYQMKVVPITNELGLGYESNIAFATTAQSAPSSPPLAVQAFVQTSTTVLLVWQPPPMFQQNGNVTGYIVNYTRVGNQYRSHPTLVGVNSSMIGNLLVVNISNLEKGINYTFAIAAVTVAQGPFSVPVAESTKPDIPSGAPFITSFTALSGTQMSFSWTESLRELQHGDISSYTVVYRRAATTTLSDGTVLSNSNLPSGSGVSTTTSYSFTVSSSGASMTIVIPPVGGPALLPSVDYEIEIAAVNIVGQGPFSATALNRTLETAPSGPPTSVSAQNSSSSSILVTWSLPIPEDRDGVITSFTLYYSRVPGQFNANASALGCAQPLTADGCPIVITRSGDGPYSFNVQFLEKYIRYAFQVAASTAAGRGVLSSPVQAYTDEDAPDGAVQNLNATARSSTSVVVTWYAPLAPQHSGVILGYKISVVRSGANSAAFDPTLSSQPLTDFTLALNNANIVLNGQSSYVLTGLQRSMGYDVTILPYTKKGDGLYPNTVFVITQQDFPAGAPLNPVSTNVASGLGSFSKSVLLTWSPPLAYLANGDITSYQITYYVSDTRLPTSVTAVPAVVINVPTTFTTINALYPFVNYVFEIRASTIVGVSSFVNTTQIVSETARPNAAPQFFNFVSTTASCPTSTTCGATAQLRWVDPPAVNQNGPYNTYTVTFYQTSDAANLAAVDRNASSYYLSTNPRTLVIATSDIGRVFDSTNKVFTNTYTITNDLQPYNNYAFSVALSSAATISNVNTLAQGRTAETIPTAPPQNVTLVATYNQISIAFATPISFLRHGVITNYVVRYTRLPRSYVANGGATQVRNSPLAVYSRNIPVSIAPVNTVITTLVLTNTTEIVAYTDYTVEVLAIVAGQSGPYSVPVSVTTGVRAPLPPDAPIVNSLLLTPTTVSLSWPVINTFWGPITRVQIVVEPAGSVAYARCNATIFCFDNQPNNYESGLDCGGDCKACTLLNLNLPVPEIGRYAPINPQLSTPVAYIAYDQTYTPGESTAGSVVVGDGSTYGSYYNGPLASGISYYFRVLAYTGSSAALMSASASGCSAAGSAASVMTPTPSAGSNVAAIAGAIIAVLAVLILIIIVLVRRRRQGKSNDPRVWFASMKSEKRENNIEVGTVPPHSSNNGYSSGASSSAAAASTTRYTTPPVQSVSPRGASTATAPVVVVKPSSAPPLVNKSQSAQQAPQPNPSAADETFRFRGACNISGQEFPPCEKHEVPIDDLSRVIQQMSANTNLAFSEEYENIESGSTIPCERAQMPENKMKNRYANILSYDHSRVVLPVVDGDATTDYINANFMDGFQAPNNYIAAQGPTPLTVNDFWRMIWENKCQVVIMVTNLEEKGRVKCHRYWPEKVHQEMSLSPGMMLTMAAEEEFPDYVIRTLTLQNGSQSRIVRQFHYISWPDHGVPESTAVTLAILRKSRAARTPGGGPAVVHCSAGVGRTGTLIAIDYNLECAAKTGFVDVYGTLNEMRRQRSTMVQTEEQYIFIYQTLLDGCSQLVTELTPEGIRQHVNDLHTPAENGGSILDVEFKKVSDFTAPQLRTDSAQLAANKSKNRFQNILPYETTRVKLLAIPGVVGSDYINASFIDGYKQKAAFIATQGPMENTVSDFWRMVWERECRSIVMLTALSESGRVKSEQYWPDPDEPPLSAGDYQIVLRGETNLGWCMERTLQIVDLVSETAREVKHWQYTSWPANGNPESGRPLVQLIQIVEQYERALLVVPEESIYGNAKAIEEQTILKQLRPCVVHCSAGVGRTGVYCALAICIRRLIEEQKMDLVSVTKHLRTQRPAMIQTAEQYEFVYRCMVDYLDMSIVPSVAQDSIYQNLAPARPKRVPPKPPTRGAPAGTSMSLPDASTNTSEDSTRPDFQESSFMIPNQEFGFGEEA